MDADTTKFFLDNGFAIAVTVYLLYERSKFNERISVTLDRIAETLSRLEQRG